MAAQKNIERWQAWDWKQQDVTLSEQHKVSRERVRQIRRQLGMSDPINKQRERRAIVL